MTTTEILRHSTTDATTSQTAYFKDRVTSTLAAGSYQIASSTGTYTDTYTGTANQNWSMIIAGFKPATTTGATTTYIVHTDHLGGTNVVTDNNGDLVQTLDYYLYGSLRLNTRSSSLDEKRKFRQCPCNGYEPIFTAGYVSKQRLVCVQKGTVPARGTLPKAQSKGLF